LNIFSVATQDADWQNITQSFAGQVRSGTEKESQVEVVGVSDNNNPLPQRRFDLHVKPLCCEGRCIVPSILFSNAIPEVPDRMSFA